MKKSAGLSLLELIVAMTIGAILVTLSMSSFNDLILQRGVKSYINEFIATLQFARSEAERRGTTVSVCKSANGSTCTNIGNWMQGYIVFTDSTTTGVAGQLDATDQLLKVQAVGQRQASMVGTGFEDWIRFQPIGAANQAGTWLTCPTGGIQFPPIEIQVSVASGSFLVNELAITACP